MISVCMATYNGELYIRQQIDSILPQLSNSDELIISDDGSTDNTIDIIRSYRDQRVKLFHNTKRHGVAGNFENAILHSEGDIIFFSNQDDVWLPGKISELSDFLITGKYDIVTCNCTLTDENLNIVRESYYENKTPLDKSAVGNFIKDLWLGCCMAFKRNILSEILPFPPRIVAHDLWIAIYGQLRFKCGYYPKSLQLYRRHGNTASFGDSKSKNSIYFRLNYRYYLAKQIIKRLINSKR